MIKSAFFAIIFFVFILLSFFYPKIFTAKVVDDFVNGQSLSLVSVILTITFASVANVQSTLHKIIKRKYRGHPEAVKTAKEIKSELHSNCWSIFYCFVFDLFALLAKGVISPGEGIAIAFVNSLILLTIVFSLFAVKDVYQVVFGLLDLENEL